MPWWFSYVELSFKSCLPVPCLFCPLALASMERSLNYPERVMKEPPVSGHYAWDVGLLRYVQKLTIPSHDYVITWKRFPYYWPFVGGILSTTVKHCQLTQTAATERQVFFWQAVVFGSMHEQLRLGAFAFIRLHPCILEASEYAFTHIFQDGFIDPWGLFFRRRLTSIPPWISTHMPGKVWDEITYPFPNFNDATVEVRLG